jgi:hypothetical protein
MRLVHICGVLVTLVASACTTGSSGIEPGNPEAGNQQLGIKCSTSYATSGTFVPNTADPPPSGFDGCWPIGGWTFTLSINTDPDSGGGVDSCAPANLEPTPLAQYQFTGSTTVNSDGDPEEHFTYTPQASDPNVNYSAKVTEGGTGICEGNLKLFDATGTQVWTMNPELNADNSITGSAEFDSYTDDQWTGD